MSSLDKCLNLPGTAPCSEVSGNSVQMRQVFPLCQWKRGLFQIFPHHQNKNFALGASQLNVIGAPPTCSTKSGADPLLSLGNEVS